MDIKIRVEEINQDKKKPNRKLPPKNPQKPKNQDDNHKQKRFNKMVNQNRDKLQDLFKEK